MSAAETHVLNADTDVTDEFTPPWAERLIASLETNQHTLSSKLEKIDKTVQSISKDLKEVKDRVSDTEKRISTLEDELEKEKSSVQVLCKQVSNISAKLDDLEARSRRNNIRIIGLKEGTESDNLMELLDRLFRYILDLEERDASPEVDRAHRALRPRPDPGDAPRAITVRLLRWRDKQKLLMAGKKKNKALLWDGQPFYIRQDLTAEVRRQRAEYNGIIEELKKMDIRVGVLYPARLIATIEGKRRIFNTPEEAKREFSLRIRKAAVCPPAPAT
ncbi:hypothetical protein WMY93_025536 [Mugilogobius chulae]|uniref:L1 transposable element RRM domain-containing protein n=1 Tax=Mugilogobius chulae TaxID=88201 RepID=A0AAW0MZ62_9GOBI